MAGPAVLAAANPVGLAALGAGTAVYLCTDEEDREALAQAALDAAKPVTSAISEFASTANQYALQAGLLFLGAAVGGGIGITGRRLSKPKTPTVPTIDLTEITKPQTKPRPPLDLIEGGGNTPMPKPPFKGPDWKKIINKISKFIRSEENLRRIEHVLPYAKQLMKVARYGINTQAAIAATGIGYRYLTDSKETGPILYDYGYKKLFGESVVARTTLGTLQSGSTEAVILNLSFHNFWASASYALIGQGIGIEHQMTSADLSIADVDWNIHTASHGLYGAMTAGFFKGAGIITSRFGTTAFPEWIMRWGNAPRPALRNGLQLTNWATARSWTTLNNAVPKNIQWLLRTVSPREIPSAKSVLVYLGFVNSTRLLQQSIASTRFIENSDHASSFGQLAERSLYYTPFDVYARMCLGPTSYFMGIVDNGAFMIADAQANKHWNKWDGQPLPVKSALQKLASVQTADSFMPIAQALRSKPFTAKNHFGASVSLSPKTWAVVSERLATDPKLRQQFGDSLLQITTLYLAHKEPGLRHVGMAAGVMAYAIAHHHPDNSSAQSVAWRTQLARDLQPLVTYGDTKQVSKLNRSTLTTLFTEIESGRYDNNKAQQLQFPSLSTLTSE